MDTLIKYTHISKQQTQAQTHALEDARKEQPVDTYEDNLTRQLEENLEERVRRDKYVSMDELVDILRDEIAELLNVKEGETSDDAVVPFDFSKKPYVIMVVGVNGGTDARFGDGELRV